MIEEISPQDRLLMDMPELYERYILLALDSNKDFWFMLSKSLCLTRSREFANDFSYPKYYAIYRALYAWRELTAGASFSPISEGGLISQLHHLSVQTPPLISLDMAMECASEFMTWREQYSPEEAYAAVKDNWRLWLSNRKTSKILDNYKRSGSTDVSKSLEKISAAVTELNNTTDVMDSAAWTMDMLVNQTDEIIERMPLSRDFANIGAALGGGLGKREHVIFLAPTGGGKTVFACQLAVELALAGRGVILVTTEQHPRELFPRFISNVSFKQGTPVKFDYIKDGFTEDVRSKLTNEQLEMCQTAAARLNSSLIVGNWTTSRTLSDLPAFIEETQKKFEAAGKTLDCVILDWIGGALTESTKDSSKLRLLMVEAANIMKNLAQQYNIATVSMAQTSKDGIDKSRVSEQHFSECKTLHYQATAAFGISAIRIKTENDEDGDVYDVRQHVYCFKSRKSKGKFWAIKRNFDYQRFENL